MNKFIYRMTVAGLTILLCFVGAVVLLGLAPTDSGQQGAGRGAVLAAAWLMIAWVVGAAGLAVFRWRETTIRFRVILAVNAAIAGLLIAQFWIE
jgi:hypothetical protein